MLVALVAFACAGPATAGTISGPSRGADVIWVSSGLPPSSTTAEMRNSGKAFVPPLLVIPIGATVRFPNDDPFYHSIYSISPPDPFDIGFYGTGPGKLVTFAHAGVVEVHCHIHVTMDGTIVVVDGPSVLPSADRFSLSGVPAGTWTVHYWSHANGDKTARVTVR